MGRSTESYEKGLRLSREAKRRRKGTCRSCGRETPYHGHGKSVSDLCSMCSRAQERERGLRRRGTTGKTAAMLKYLDRPRRRADFRDHFGMTKGYADAMIGRLLKYGLIERVSRGVYQRVEK
jgi:hypothetical protein